MYYLKLSRTLQMKQIRRKVVLLIKRVVDNRVNIKRITQILLPLIIVGQVYVAVVLLIAVELLWVRATVPIPIGQWQIEIEVDLRYLDHLSGALVARQRHLRQLIRSVLWKLVLLVVPRVVGLLIGALLKWLLIELLADHGDVDVWRCYWTAATAAAATGNVMLLGRVADGRADGTATLGRRDAGLLVVELLLVLHPAILEPDLYLPLAQHQFSRQFDAARAAEVVGLLEFALQFDELGTRVGGPRALAVGLMLDTARRTCKTQLSLVLYSSASCSSWTLCIQSD